MAIRKTTPGGGLASLNIIGSIDCSTNPDYPKADAGDIYIVSHSGYIGGDPAPSPDNGQQVTAGDFIVCEVDGTAAGTHAAVGANWTIIQASTSVNYTNANPILTAIGGISVGETFLNQTMKQMWDNLLYPYIAPVVSLASTPTTAVNYEKGDASIVAVNLTPTITKKSSDITSLTISRSGVGVIKTYTQIPAWNTGAAYSEAVYADGAVTDTTTYTATAGDGTTNSTSTRTYTFMYPYLYGSDADGLTGAQMYTNLTKVIQTPTDGLTLTFSPNSERVYFVVPPGSTPYTQVLDQNLFDVTADFLPSSTISITGLDGTPQTYTVYEIDHDIGDGSAITFTFNF